VTSALSRAPILALALMALGALAPGEAARAQAPEAISDQAFAEALTPALHGGDYGAALALLDARPDIAALPAGVRLRAELLAKLGRTSAAIALLEGHLAQDTTDALARFQVGELHFQARRDREAVLAYRLALAGTLDAARRSIVQARLGEIENRRDLRISVAASITPDSNINGATSASTIDLFGLPFTLSEDARRRAGVAATVSGSIERRLRLTDRYSLNLGGSALVLDASGRTFDQSQVSLFAGPEVRLAQHAKLNLAATYRDIDFGGADLETWRGLRLAGEAYADPQTRWDGALHLDRIANQRAEALDGWTYGVQAARTRFLGPSALWRASVGLDAHDLVGSEVGYREAHLAVGRLFALPFSSLGYLEPYGHERVFDQRSSAFGVRRTDREVGATFRISRRDWRVMGAFPFVQAVVSRSTSNVSLGRYSRQRVEFGFTRDF
jgi:tetratricopeptide (TPR) repeat protein